jgi:signal transduction histidine kinase
VQIAATHRPLPDGRVWDGLFTDITPHKEAEARLLLSQAQLRELTAHLQSAKEAERANIAREIHDEIGGSLTAMKADLASLAKRVEDRAGMERIESLGRLVDGAMRLSQAIARSLRPSTLDQGLYPALRWQARDFTSRHGIPVNLSANDEELELDLESATALFRIFQEGLTNIAKHAAAQAVEATLFSNGSSVTLEIRDDGKGLDAASLDRTGSFGVFGMHERVRNLGGWLEIDGSPGRGTTLMVSLPRIHRAGRTP